MKQQKVLIGMSGGVDSSVAAYLLQQADFDCIGASMQLCSQSLLGNTDACGSSAGSQDALRVANRLGMPFYILNATEHFEEKVIEPFIHAYEAGDTPNPCILCNQHLKFTHMLQQALSLGCDYVATGHYAQVRYCDESGRYLLYKAADTAKDQTYFLAGLTQYQLQHTLFPLGGLTKEQVRQIAGEQGFVNAQKRDSQDICFIPDGDYKAFLERYTGKTYPPGCFLDLQGNVVGTHNGSVGYTIGQRKGLGLAMGEPVYVCSKDLSCNTVTVGPNSALFHSALEAVNWNWIAIDELTKPMAFAAKIRSRHAEQPATVYPLDNGAAKVVFDTPQRAITPGQTVVLYDGDIVIGSGTIVQAIS